MPIYEYECSECGQIEEALQKMSDPPLSTCKHCHGKLHKILSQSSFHLKGSGWYVTDYGGSTSKADASSVGSKAPSTPSASCAQKSAKVDTPGSSASE
jgi:putative FmdB family regulatory protein